MNRIIVFVASFLLFVVSSAEVIKAPPVSSQPYAKPALGPVEQFSSYSGQNLFDGDTLLKNWKAGENLKAPPERITTFEPVIRDGKYEPTGKKPPVAAVRSSPGEPFFDLDFGELAIGCYVVRVIAAVKTEDIEKYRKPVYLDFYVNDKPGGGESWYRHRVPYWDDFYAVTELYLNVDEKREYRGRVSAGIRGMADLYIHSIEFHDVLARLPRKAVKQKPGRYSFEERERLRANSDQGKVWGLVREQSAADIAPGKPFITGEARLKRDDLLWNAFPPLNSQFVANYDEGFAAQEQALGKMSVKEASERYGSWALGRVVQSGWRTPILFTNEKLKLTWDRNDLANHRLLPDPYPFKDDGSGIWFPKEEGTERPTHFFPIAVQLGDHWLGVWNSLANWHGEASDYELPYLYHALADENAARDASFILARWAYTYPTHTDSQSLGYATIAPAWMYNRDMRLRIRALMFYWGSPRGINLQMGLARAYDFLFDYIQGNQEFAAAVGRYIPWVRTEHDVRRLIETRILQFGAKQSMRFQLSSSKSHSVCLLHTCLIQQDPEVTRPWMESLWKNTHVYPHPRAGLPEFVSTTTQRDGTTDIGSVFYTSGGSPFLQTVAMTRRYVENGGDKKYDLTDFELYGKMPFGSLFPLESCVAGGFPLTIGDVGSPAKPRALEQMGQFEEQFRYAFKWLKDFRVAWILKHYFGRRDESDLQWSQLEKSAMSRDRNPFLDQRSRLMASWAGILESGQESNDYRFKRTAFMRTGLGVGHAHNDALDLQYIAHGFRAANDLGHRGSYTTPKAPRAIVHNRVIFNSKRHPRDSDWNGYSWIGTFKDLPGAQYMQGTAIPAYGHKNVRLFQRSVALIDVDDGRPSPAPYEGLYQGGKTRHDPNVVTPNSYVFDVQRVDGGIWHTWCFHGCWSDDFQTNMAGRKAVGQSTHDQTPPDTSEDAAYLMKFLDGEGHKYAGDTPADGHVIATWRLRRKEESFDGFLPHTNEKRVCIQRNAEEIMLGADYDEKAPRRYTRVHLPGRLGERMLVGQPAPIGPDSAGQSWPFLMVQNRNDEPKSSIYPSIIEAYVDQPFISRVSTPEIADNDSDALRAVALKVETINGHEDFCFSDGHEDRWRKITDIEVAAKFLYLSSDKEGLRMAQMIEGKGMKSPRITIETDRTAYQGKIVSVDYLRRYIRVHPPLPETLSVGQVFEIGNREHRTSFRTTSAGSYENETGLSLDRPADLSYARILKIDLTSKRVYTNIGPAIHCPGNDGGLTCTNEEMSKVWKCNILGRQEGGYAYQLQGDFTEDDLPPGSTFRLWEFGVGDEIRIPTHVQVSRGADGKYILNANTGVRLKINGRNYDYSNIRDTEHLMRHLVLPD